jgi:hypothetical protein
MKSCPLNTCIPTAEQCRQLGHNTRLPPNALTVCWVLIRQPPQGLCCFLLYAFLPAVEQKCSQTGDCTRLLLNTVSVQRARTCQVGQRMGHCPLCNCVAAVEERNQASEGTRLLANQHLCWGCNLARPGPQLLLAVHLPARC